MKSERLENPFPQEAVATHGQRLRYSAKLRSMSALQDELVAYLSNYEIASRRFGAAIGICGEHGSGKTHILTWLETRGNDNRRSDCAIVYVKIDAARILDIYQQIIRKIERSRIIELLQRALLTIARQEVRAAEVTEGIGERLTDIESLNELLDEGSLDRTRLENLLQKRLEEVAPADFVRTLLDCVGPSGEAAYHWLRGEEVTNIAPLGIVHKFPSGAAVGAAVDADDTMALHGLTLLATLHELADVPLVILVDQLEVLLRAEGSRQETLSSLAKRCIEALSAAKALLFIAGTDDGWSRLTRDVFPRFRGGQPLRVGGLDRDQIATLIDAYVRGETEYGKEALDRLLEVTGGSPREILRISHLAFDAGKGKLERVSDADIVAFAQSASTIADRSRLALVMIDSVIHGRYESSPLRFDEGSVDRLVRIGNQPIAAIMLLRAADATEEALAARMVRDVAGHVSREWPAVRVIVVTVGYTSKQIKDVLEPLTTVVPFNEESLRDHIETELTRAAAKAGPGAPTSVDASVTKALDSIAKRLEQIETRRQTENEAVAQRLEKATEIQVRSDTAQVELRTRWEILDQLELVETACSANDFDGERGLMRALLVGNEAHRKDPVLDQLGGMYLDLITMAVRQRRGVAPPEPPLRGVRLDLLTTMRSHLNATSLHRLLMEHPGRVSLYIGAVTAVIALTILSALTWPTNPRAFWKGGFSTILYLHTLISLLIGAVAGLAWFARSLILSPVRLWRVRVGRLLPDHAPYAPDVARDNSIKTVRKSIGIALYLALVLFGGVVLLVAMLDRSLSLARIPAGIVVAIAAIIAWRWWRASHEPVPQSNKIVTVALISLAGLACLGTLIVLTVGSSRGELIDTDTVTTDTWYATDTLSTDVSATETTGTMSTTGTSTYEETDTSATATSGTSDTYSSTTTT